MNKDKGFVSLIIIIIVALALVNYFWGWSIFDAASSEKGSATLNYVKELLTTIWSYLKAPVAWIWARIIELLPSQS